MDLQINLVKHLLTALTLGDEEISLVRKKLKWSNKPFEIPQEIFDEWRKIGHKGGILEKNWRENIDKKNAKLLKDFRKRLYKF